MGVSIKLDEKSKEKLREIAKAEDRTLSNLIQKILHEWLREKEKLSKK